jgi:hypothetical protein
MSFPCWKVTMQMGTVAWVTKCPAVPAVMGRIAPSFSSMMTTPVAPEFCAASTLSSKLQLQW